MNGKSKLAVAGTEAWKAEAEAAEAWKKAKEAEAAEAAKAAETEVSSDKPVRYKLVARYSPLFQLWYLCHALSYQNAYRSDVNGFKTRQEAVDFAAKEGHEIEHHEYDRQQYFTPL